jgi:short subunit dehydrogenase-like uncharacterized protein
MHPRKQARALDIVLFGATGFTGRLVAHHLAGSGVTLRWAIAGRAAGKLAALAAELRLAHPAQAAPDIMVADAAIRADMDRLAGQARVVCTTAGPFARYGSPLVAACAASGTDYCDITGEVHWVREMIDAHHDQALASGARLVHFCGFDSIPSDLGTWALQQEMLARFGVPAAEVTAYYGEMKGTFSGGTFASLLGFVDAAKADRTLARRMAAPYALNPDPEYRGPDRRDVRSIRYDRKMGVFTAPFVMAATNARAVRRGHALAGFPWGHDFHYTELASTPGSASGLARAVATTGGLAAVVGMAASRRLRPLLERKMPKPGEGPSQAEREAGYYKVRLVGHTGAHRLMYVVADRADPGYGSTCKMLGQSALCLAFDTPAPAALRAGSLTPSVAMGAALLRRLRAVGMTFEVAL